jgi:hypothetical protein
MLTTNSSRGDDTYGSQPKPSTMRSKFRAPIRLLAVATIVIAVFMLWPHRAVRVYDGFDAAELGSHWLKWQFVPGSVKMQSKVVRAGRGAVEITLHRGDRREGPGEEGQLLERDEITESWRYFSRLQCSYRYSFSLFFTAVCGTFRNSIDKSWQAESLVTDIQSQGACPEVIRFLRSCHYNFGKELL